LADFRDLEQLVATIQRQLAPRAKVLHNQYLPGRKSGRRRQIDVLVHDRIGQYEIQIVIDCKDYKSPADVKSVEEFYGLLDDVGAQKGVLVCPAGFTATAKKRAEGLQIDLYSPVDTDPHKWTAKAKIPAICDFRRAALSFGLSVTGPYPFSMPYDFQFTNQVVTPSGETIGTLFEIFIDKWNNGELPIEPGDHEEIRVFGDNPHMDNGHGRRIPVDLWGSLRVRKDLFYGLLPITRISGFKDEIRGGVITNAFTAGIATPDEIFDTWTKIGSEEVAPLAPVIEIRGLVGWDREFPTHQQG
jgi:Restriction endonuclease